MALVFEQGQGMNREDIIRMAREAKLLGEFDTAECIVEDGIEIWLFGERGINELTQFAALVASAERAFCHQLMLDFIEEFMGYEKDRHPMFSEGYDLALYHMKKLIEGVKHD